MPAPGVPHLKQCAQAIKATAFLPVHWADGSSAAGIALCTKHSRSGPTLDFVSATEIFGKLHCLKEAALEHEVRLELQATAAQAAANSAASGRAQLPQARAALRLHTVEAEVCVKLPCHEQAAQADDQDILCILDRQDDSSAVCAPG